jgi:hypothetical protein
MRILQFFAVAMIISLLASCASVDNGVVLHSQSVNAAIVTGRWNKDKLLIWEGHRLDVVDGTPVSFGWVSNPYSVGVRIDPGHRKLVILALFNNSSTQYSATIPMEVDLKPSVNYMINANISGNFIESWLEVATTGERVTDKFRGQCLKSVALGNGLFQKGPCF